MNTLVLRYLPGILFNTKGKVLLQAMGITHQYNYELAATVLTKMTEEHTTATNIRIQALELLNIRFPSNPIIVSKGLLNRPLLDIETTILVVVLAQDDQDGLQILFEFLASDSIPLQQIALVKMSH
tara:strand:- start:18965 stop:19342 length:378 start_codon:yes stop_codon:yes gene_type:complete